MHRVSNKSTNLSFKLEDSVFQFQLGYRELPDIIACRNNQKSSDNFLKTIIFIKVIEENDEQKTVALLLLELIFQSGY